MKKYRLGIAGSGYLANIIIDAEQKGLLSDYELVAIYGRTPAHVMAAVDLVNHESEGQNQCKVCNSLQELLSCELDYVVEAASVQCVKEIAIPVLKARCNLVLVSIGALADETFKQQIEETAREQDAKVYLASGAVGGFDVLRTISLMGEAKASFVSRKHPASLKNTPLYQESLMDQDMISEVFHGSAKEAIEILPTKVNVAVATALASVGAEHLEVSINSDLDMKGDDYVITSQIPGYRASVNIYSETSAIAAWSVVSVLRNIAAPIVF